MLLWNAEKRDNPICPFVTERKSRRRKAARGSAGRRERGPAGGGEKGGSGSREEQTWLLKSLQPLVSSVWAKTLQVGSRSLLLLALLLIPACASGAWGRARNPLFRVAVGGCDRARMLVKRSTFMSSPEAFRGAVSPSVHANYILCRWII